MDLVEVEAMASERSFVGEKTKVPKGGGRRGKRREGGGERVLLSRLKVGGKKGKEREGGRFSSSLRNLTAGLRLSFWDSRRALRY